MGAKHPHIPYTQDLYADARINSSGLDLANDAELRVLNDVAVNLANTQFQAAAMGTAFNSVDTTQAVPVINPAQHQDVVGTVYEATSEQAEIALTQALNAQSFWANLPKNERAACLNKAAELMEQRLLPLMVLLSRESGKTYANAIAEVREAVDFLRYYAAQVLDLSDHVQIQPLGTLLCISPWNFRWQFLPVRFQRHWLLVIP